MNKNKIIITGAILISGLLTAAANTTAIIEFFRQKDEAIDSNKNDLNIDNSEINNSNIIQGNNSSVTTNNINSSNSTPSNNNDLDQPNK